MEVEKTYSCPKCSRTILRPFKDHFEGSRACPLSDGIVKKNNSLVSFEDGTFICLRCFK